MLIKSLFNGKEINLTGDNVVISSNNFNVDKNGNMECSNANITGGKINLETTRALGDKVLNVKDDMGAESYIGTVNASIGYTGGNTLSGVYLQGEASGQSMVRAQVITQTSLESQKKNIEKLEKGLEIVKNTEIYKYHFITQKNEDKKHIGFVIGDNYKYSKDITSLDGKGNEIGVDSYSMISVAYRAIQEQQEIIENLEKRIKELEEQ